MEARQPANRAVKIDLLGGFKISFADRILKSSDWSRRKSASLLERLAYEGRLAKEQAMEFLWPGLDPERGANNLYQAIYIMRQTLDQNLGPGSSMATLSFENGVLRLGEAVRVDAPQFEALCAQAIRDGSLDLLRQALDLYRGDFLPDEIYEEWTFLPRQSLRRRYRQACLELAARLEALGQHTGAIELLSPLAEAEPTDETVQRELMRLYALSGRRHAALHQYQNCVRALAEELEAEPEEQTASLYAEILGGAFTHQKMNSPAIHPPSEVWDLTEADSPLAGRQAEIDELCQLLLAPGGGHGQMALIAGQAGIGKTRLAIEALRRASQAGSQVLYGAAYEEEGQLPYQPFVEAFDRYIQQASGGALVNPISHYQPLGTSDPQMEHSALFRETARFLGDLARHQPVVLFIDDLHAADEDSLHLFHYLARRTSSSALSLLASYRTDLSQSPASPFLRLLNALYREGHQQTLYLQSLDRAAAAEIVSQTLAGEPDPRLVELVYDWTEGNPFYVQEITRALDRLDRLESFQGRWRLKPGASLQVPRGLQGILKERVQRLGPQALAALSTAAVVGREFSFNTLRQLSNLADPPLLDILDAAISGSLLEEAQPGYRFQHALIRYTLYELLSRDRRAWLHRRVAEIIESQFPSEQGELNPQAENLAFHYQRSDRPVKALPYLLQSGQKAARIYALEVACDYYEQALAILDAAHSQEAEMQDPGMRWMILEQLGWWWVILAKTPLAVKRFEQALAIQPPPGSGWQPSNSDRVRLHRAAARTLITAGQIAQAEQHLQAALVEAEQESAVTDDRAYLLYDLALWHWHANNYERSLELARQSLVIAQQLDDPTALARTYEMLALATHSLGDWKQGLEYERQRAALTGHGLDVTEAFDVHLCLWEYHLFGDLMFEEVHRTVAATMEQAERMGAPRAIALCKCFSGALDFQRGGWQAAEVSLRDSIRLYHQIGASAGEAMASHRLGVLLTAEGRLDAAMQVMGDGVLAAERALMRFHCLARLYSAMASNRLQANDLVEAERELELGLAMSARHGHCSTCDSLVYPAAVGIRIAQGDLQSAEHYCQELDLAAERYGSRMWRAMACQARGELAAAGGQFELAESFFSQAQKIFEQVGYLYGSARCLRALANLYNSQPGQSGEQAARRYETQAEQIFARLLNG